ncbi:MBL fold metallo-hydrolase [Limibacter armeniacum]|uniref:MBL fold metallo-hydrolase n=1 Tax=Limibacter armeniacum TaxID=466084 RepID=UPI002FE5514E
MELTFWGAAQQVTGSMFLLTLEDEYRILIDCGIDMGNLSETMPLYPGSNFPFDASLVNLVLLTHAHLDHSGKIPNLYREGFEGQVLCTSPTMALTELLLLDSASINQKKLKAYHRKLSKGMAPEDFNFDPRDLYVEKDVYKAVDRFVPIQFHRRFNVKHGVHVTFIPTGHLLGAANILLEVEENGETKSIMFSGDIGRSNYPLLQDPHTVPQVDYLICETTYGNREHQSIQDATEAVEDVIRRTCIDKPGRLIIPAFSIGRTQAIIYTLHKLYAENKLPPIKIFADSPLAQRSNVVYEKYTGFLNEEANDFKREHGSLFRFDTVQYVEAMKDSQAIDNYHEPCIIISSSGMMEGGRIQHHIRANMENSYCTILMVGYSAEGTLGNRLLNSNGNIRIGTREYPIKANIEQTDSFSGHGDIHDLLKFVRQQDKVQTKKIFLVHGEGSSMEDFKSTLNKEGYNQVEIPEKGQKYQL